MFQAQYYQYFYWFLQYLECEISLSSEEEDEDVISKIKDFEKINGDIRSFARIFWIDKEIKKPILFDGWDEDEFAEQLEEDVSWFEPNEENLGNTLFNML